MLNAIAAVAFTVGGSLFALGTAVAQLGSGDPTTSACIYFAGGLFFNTGGYTTLLQAINYLLDSFLQGLTAKQENRLIWAPDMVGCAMFLISGHLALAEVCHGRLCVRPRELGGRERATQAAS